MNIYNMSIGFGFPWFRIRTSGKTLNPCKMLSIYISACSPIGWKDIYPLQAGGTLFFHIPVLSGRGHETFLLHTACCRLARIMPDHIFNGLLLKIRAGHKIRACVFICVWKNSIPPACCVRCLPFDKLSAMSLSNCLSNCGFNRGLQNKDILKF